MTDPRNIAHDKKVRQAKKHQHQEIVAGADGKPQPGKKPHPHHEDKPAAEDGLVDVDDASDHP